METNNPVHSNNQEKCMENRPNIPQSSGQGPPMRCWGPPPPFAPCAPMGPSQWRHPYQNSHFLYGAPYLQPPGIFTSPPPMPPSHLESVNSIHPADKVWLNSWIESRSLKREEGKQLSDQSFKICEAHQKFKMSVLELKRLRAKHDILHMNLLSFSQEEWNKNWADIESVMSHIKGILDSFSKPESVSALKANLLKRSKKRKRLRQQLVQHKVQMYQRQVNRQNLHQQADTWLADMQNTVERARLDENLKQKADIVLSEVTRRQSDGRRQIALLDALQKLRRARIQAIEAQSGTLSNDQKKQTDQSNTIIDRLLGLWSRQMDEYSKEERGLRVMLEESAAKQSDVELQNVRRILSQWEACLFGSDHKQETMHRETLDFLVSVRKAWDQFLVPDDALLPMASTIPVGWVLPTTPSSLEWQKWLLQ